MSVKFYRVKNNTENPLTINSTYILPQTDAIMGDDIINTIDTIYFSSNILINLGEVDVGTDYININAPVANYYVKPPLGIPKTHLDSDVNTSLKRADMSVQSGNISLTDLSTSLQTLLNTLSSQTSSTPSSPSSVLVSENQLSTSIRNSLSLINALNQKINVQGIGFENLTSDVQYILDQVNTTFTNYWKSPVATFALLPIDGNNDGDIRLNLEDNSFWVWSDSSTQWTQIVSSSTASAPPASGTVDVASSKSIIAEFFATNNQTTFKSQVPYPLGSNNLQVMVNGLLMMKDVDYTEVDIYTVKFNTGLMQDDYVVFSLTYSSGITPISIENIVVSSNYTRKISLNKAYTVGQDSIRVYLNGLIAGSGEDSDYTEIDQTTIQFNYDLYKDDKIIVRTETTGSVMDNVNTEINNMQKVYLDLAKQINSLRLEVRSKL